MALSTVYLASLWVGYFTEFALLTCSLIFCVRRNKPAYVKIFLIYAVINPIPDMLELIFPARQYLIYSTWSIFELAYFTYFLTLLYSNKTATKILWGISLLWILRWTIRLIGLHDVNAGDFTMITQQFTGEGIILMGGCVEYIREIMAKATIPVLSKEPAFWMVSGIFCYFIVLAPTFLFTNFAVSHHLPDVGMTVYSVNNFCQGLDNSALHNRHDMQDGTLILVGFAITLGLLVSMTTLIFHC